MIWKYKAPTSDGAHWFCFGCPVTVRIPGVGELRAVYQFQGGEGGQQCAVVNLRSGRVIAPVYDHHKGYPEQRAQAAIDERFARIDDPATAWARACDKAETINTLPSVVGVLR